MNPTLKTEFERVAENSKDSEVVALLVENPHKPLHPLLRFVPNAHHTPKNAFTILPKDWIASGRVLAVVHSHTSGTEAPSSPADLIMSEETGVPWFIYSLETKKWAEHIPTGLKMPLTGRPFIWGVLDCFALARDFYLRQLNINSENYYREWEFWKRYDAITPLLEREGMVRVENPSPYDIIVMNIGSKYPNHLAVLTADTRHILHHAEGRLSGINVFGGIWMSSVTGVYRHKTRV